MHSTDTAPPGPAPGSDGRNSSLALPMGPSAPIPMPPSSLAQPTAASKSSPTAAVTATPTGVDPSSATPTPTSTAATATSSVAPSTGYRECAGCRKRITERYLLKALDMFWHEDCLKCGCCDCRLGEIGSTLYTRANLILCRRDYLRLFGTTGQCAACSKVIPAFELVMRVRDTVYHLDCFACQQCSHRFCIGDRFYICDNKILCESDYTERLVFANMACSTGGWAHIRSLQEVI